MKRFIVFFLMIAGLTVSTYAQNIKLSPTVIPAQGHHASVGNFGLSWTMGDVTNREYFGLGNIKIATGFQRMHEMLPADSSANAGNISVNSDTICLDSISIISLSAYNGNIKWQIDTGNGWKTYNYSKKDTIYLVNKGESISYRALVTKDGRYWDTSAVQAVYVENCFPNYLFIDLKTSCYSKLSASVPSVYKDSSKILVISKDVIVSDTLLLYTTALDSSIYKLYLLLDDDKNINGVYSVANSNVISLDTRYYQVQNTFLKLYCDPFGLNPDSIQVYVQLYKGVLINPAGSIARSLNVIGVRATDVVEMLIKNKAGNTVYSTTNPLQLNWNGLSYGHVLKGSYEYNLVVNGTQYKGKFLIDDKYE